MYPVIMRPITVEKCTGNAESAIHVTVERHSSGVEIRTID